MTASQTQRALPRRANGIRSLAAQMASKKLTEVSARQSVSDRIGYGVAVLFGATVLHYGGEKAVAVALLLYAVSAARAYGRYRTLKDL